MGFNSEFKRSRSVLILPSHLRLGLHNNIYIYIYCGPGSSVGIATNYGLDGPGSNPAGDEIFARPDRPWGPPSLLYNGYRVFPGGKVRPERAADHSLTPF